MLFEDDRIIVVDKLRDAGSSRWRRSVWALIGLFKDARPTDDLDLVHRLDRETSGVLVISKTKSPMLGTG